MRVILNDINDSRLSIQQRGEKKMKSVNEWLFSTEKDTCDINQSDVTLACRFRNFNFDTFGPRC